MLGYVVDTIPYRRDHLAICQLSSCHPRRTPSLTKEIE
jgi:hypothetical protein